MQKIQLPDGRSPDAESVDFESVEQNWDEYKLEDGTTLKIKLQVNGIYRLEDEYDEMGEPIYVVNTNNQVRLVDIPDELMQHEEDEDIELGVE